MKPFNLIVAVAIISGTGAILAQSRSPENTVRSGPGSSKFIVVNSASEGQP